MHLIQLLKINLEKSGHFVWSTYHAHEVVKLMLEREAQVLVLDAGALGAKELVRDMTAHPDLFAVKVVVLEQPGKPSHPPGADVYLQRGPTAYWDLIKKLD